MLHLLSVLTDFSSSDHIFLSLFEESLIRGLKMDNALFVFSCALTCVVFSVHSHQTMQQLATDKTAATWCKHIVLFVCNTMHSVCTVCLCFCLNSDRQDVKCHGLLRSTEIMCERSELKWPSKKVIQFSIFSSNEHWPVCMCLSVWWSRNFES